jgi:hypothetical protein
LCVVCHTPTPEPKGRFEGYFRSTSTQKPLILVRLRVAITEQNVDEYSEAESDNEPIAELVEKVGLPVVERIQFPRWYRRGWRWLALVGVVCQWRLVCWLAWWWWAAESLSSCLVIVSVAGHVSGSLPAYSLVYKHEEGIPKQSHKHLGQIIRH